MFSIRTYSDGIFKDYSYFHSMISVSVNIPFHDTALFQSTEVSKIFRGLSKEPYIQKSQPPIKKGKNWRPKPYVILS
jgi:hypothetical protein